MSQTFSERNLMKPGSTESRVENPKQPAMPEAVKNSETVHGPQMVPDAAPQRDAKGMPEPAAQSPASDAVARAEQQPTAAVPSGESYLRLRVRVNGKQMSVVQAAEVDGPLAQPEMLGGKFVYEVAHEGKRIAAEHIPDLGVRRSFPRKDGPLEGRVHHFEPLSVFEFTVRVPKAALAQADLPKTQIALYEIKADTPPQPMSPQVLSAQFSQNLREIARMNAIQLDAMPESARDVLQKALRK